MVRRIMLASLVMIFVFSLSGCVTMRRNSELEIQGLRNQVSVLESQLRAKDEEMNSLKESLLKSSENASENKVSEAKERPNNKQIQLALVNAGYYQGSIDGKLGKKTILALKAFQKANNLSADGKIGKKTWLALKEYLEKKVK